MENSPDILTIKNIISEKECDYISKVFFENVIQETRIDSQVPESNIIYGHPLFETLLTSLTDDFSHHIGKSLIQTYAFARLYKKGQELKIHKDRPSCEYSFTLHLYSSDETNIWPIYFRVNKKPVEILLNKGDCAFYKGCDLYHWRESCPVDKYLQVFLHYVDKHGVNGDYAYDRRVREALTTRS